MPSYELTLIEETELTKWQLHWDDTNFSLTAPDGHMVFAVPLSQAVRLIEVEDLFALENSVSINAPRGIVTFRAPKDAVLALRAFVETGLRQDHTYRTAMKGEASRSIPVGIVIFIIASILFGLGCWWIGNHPTPPVGQETMDKIIRYVMRIALGASLFGLCLIGYGIRNMRVYRRVEQKMADEGLPTEDFEGPTKE